MEPFLSQIDFDSGRFLNFDSKTTRKLSDMQNMFFDNNGFNKALAEGDPKVYEVLEIKVPEEQGQLMHAITIIYPGKIGDEYFMTKGHFHTNEDTAELYLGLKGEGAILMQTKEWQVSYLKMQAGSLVYVPPYWAHRTINISNTEFSFLAVYPGDAGHNYGSIEKTGFPKLVVEKAGQTVLIDNPKYRG